MEVLGTISAVDSLCGTVISLVKKLVTEVKRAQKDVATLPHEVQNLQTQCQKLVDRVTEVKEANAELQKVHSVNPKLGGSQSKEGELEKVLQKLGESLQIVVHVSESLNKDAKEPRSKKISLALIRMGAASLQKQIQEILRRIEVDFRDLDKSLAVRNFAGGVRTEAGIHRVERGVDKVAADIDQGFKDVMDRLPMIPDPQSSGTTAQQCQVLPEYPVAMEERASSLEETVNSLKDGEIVGIFGMGGIGKSTLAKQVFNNISEKFVYTCFVNDVKSIQPRELDEEILKKFQKIGGISSLRSWADLTHEKALIIMDDIDRHEQLASVLSRRREFKKGSVVMFTTRDSNICNKKYIVSFEVPLLEEGDARKLLCKHAFDEEDIPERLQAEMSTYVEKVVNKCDGLPLSLEVIGSYLYMKNTETWKGTIRKLPKAQGVDGAKEDRLFATLKVSYDALAEEEQQMFLDIATFFVGEPLDFALAAMSTSYVDPGTCWGNLIKRCLVKEKMDCVYHTERAFLNCRLMYVTENRPEFETQHVWMHEHLQDLGKRLAGNSFLSGSNEAANEIVEEINSHKGLGEIKHLRSVSCSYPPWGDMHEARKKVLQMSSLAKVTGLKYLRLYYCHHQDPSQELPRDLALLQWQSQEGYDFSSRLRDMKNLTVLELEDTDSHPNAKRCVQPLDSLGGLTKLKILALKGSMLLDPMKLKYLPESFGELLSLEVLVLKYVDVTHLPESFENLSSIKTLVFSWCVELTQLPESFGNLSSLRSLTIEHCLKLTRLPRSFSNLSGLSILSCPDTELVEFEDAFQNLSMFQNLQVLQLHLLNANVPPSFSQLSGCKTLQYVRLTLTQENSDTDVCWDLSPLERLTLQGNELTALSQEFGRRVSGDKVDLRFELEKGSAGSSQRSPAMTAIEIRRKKGVPSLLQGPVLLGRPEVQIFPKSLGKLPSIGERIEELEMCEDDLIEEADSSTRLSSFDLRVFQVRFNSQLKTPPNSVGQLGSLKVLKISGCAKLKTLPESLGQLGSLKELEISGCWKLKTLPESLEHLGSLQWLTISYCGRLLTLPESLEHLGSLQTLTIRNCGELLTLPESMGNLALLTYVSILRCSKLKAVPQNWGKVTSSPGQASASSCSHLRRQRLDLWVEDCPSLMDFVRNLKWDSIEETSPGSHHFCRKKEV